VDDINAKVAQIADLNQKIAQVEVDGHSANDHRDQRDLLLKELSNLIDINHFEDADGYMTVLTGSGKPLVDNVNSWSLATSPNASGFKNVNWVDSNGALQDITGELNAGQLKGLIEARDTLIPGYLNDIDTLAQTIMDEVNVLHSAGFALDGSTNNDFFDAATGQTMEIDAAILADINLIAASSTAAGVPGDDSNAIAIAQLQSSLTMNGNTTTFDDYYGSMVRQVGSDVRSAGIYFDHQTSMLSQLENYREEVSGVNLDEEMIDLVKFQHAYQAAAKIISNVDEMLETLISMA
jgi:flagellar hook-associated protein 1 FlgK